MSSHTTLEHEWLGVVDRLGKRKGDLPCLSSGIVQTFRPALCDAKQASEFVIVEYQRIVLATNR